LFDYEQFSQTRCNLRRARENPMFRQVRDQKPGTLGSQDWFDNPDNIDETAFHIVRVLAQGLTIEERTPDGS
jgi:hypothetical protein